MNRTAKSFIVLLALLALAGAQVFGLQRGFLCECSGVTVETTYEYCHHVQGHMHEPCSEDHHEHDGHCSVPMDHQHGNQGGSHEHAPLKVELTASSQGKDASAAATGIPAPAPLPFSELPDFLAFLIAAPGDAENGVTQSGPPLHAHGGGLPGIRETAKCMVLLI